MHRNPHQTPYPWVPGNVGCTLTARQRLSLSPLCMVGESRAAVWANRSHFCASEDLAEVVPGRQSWEDVAGVTIRLGLGLVAGGREDLEELSASSCGTQGLGGKEYRVWWEEGPTGETCVPGVEHFPEGSLAQYIARVKWGMPGECEEKAHEEAESKGD